MRRSGILALVLLAAWLAGGGSASGQAPPPVAGPLASGATLLAFDRGADLCLVLDGAGEGTGCAPPARSLRHPNLDSSPTGDGLAFYGTVTPDVAAVELQFADGRRVAAPTTPGPAYRGRYAGRVRFFLAEAPVDQQPFLIRLVDAGGQTLAAADQPFAPAPVVARPVTVERGRSGGRPWRAQTVVELRLRATPLEPDRLERVACVGVVVPELPLDLTGESCVDEGPLPGVVAFNAARGCTTGGILSGIADARVRAVTAVLGDGRRRAVGLHPVPGTDRRAFVHVAGLDTAVRRLDLRNAAGQIVARIAGQAPARLTCSDGDGGVIGVFGFGGLADRRAPAGPLRFGVRDAGARICLTTGDFAPGSDDCRLPPLEPIEGVVLRRTAAGATLVAGVVPAEVQAVRVRLSGGAAPVVATVPDVPGYGGRYAGTVRFFSLLVPAPRRALGADLLGVGGRRIDRLAGPDFAPLAARGPVRRYRGLRLALTPPPFPACAFVDDVACVGPEAADVAVVADCAPRRLVMAALLRGRATGLDVRLAGGRTVRARVLRLRGRAGRRARLAVAILPRRAVPREVVLRGTERRRTLLAPSAAQQCGYSENVTFPEPR
jgi:hypothetical protein